MIPSARHDWRRRGGDRPGPAAPLGRGHGAVPSASSAGFPRLALAASGLLLLAGCAARQAAGAVAPEAPGFLLGLWHGFIFPLAWIVSLFADEVAVYAVPNNGGWYDFGYFLGICVFGVGARKTTRIVVRERVVHERAATGSHTIVRDEQP